MSPEFIELRDEHVREHLAGHRLRQVVRVDVQLEDQCFTMSPEAQPPAGARAFHPSSSDNASLSVSSSVPAKFRGEEVLVLA